jgi:hypothetical protein
MPIILIAVIIAAASIAIVAYHIGRDNRSYGYILLPIFLGPLGLIIYLALFSGKGAK